MGSSPTVGSSILAVTILQRILETKREEIASRKRVAPVVELKARLADVPPPRGFHRALRNSPNPIALIAEIKRASPSKGVIRADFDPMAIAERYCEAGADALSILTDEPYFHGKPEYLHLARERVPLPALRKDFLIEEYQVYESRALEADAILLIVAALPDRRQLHDLRALAESLGMDALVEVHDEWELETALESGATLIGINNRDLRTFEVSLETTFRLLRYFPDEITRVSESGIETAEQVQRLHAAGVHALLVGETLMRTDDPAAMVRAWMDACR
ncbi:MAG: indole-3-glycerol phosphate synthase TrpC [Fimbriimonadales bacterium]|nr:indole-3-glycerol phosphate synthase TrpC [Fimbriimonadales bacterium]